MCTQKHQGHIVQSTSTCVPRTSGLLDNYPWSVPLLENGVWFGVYGLGSAVLWTIHPLLAGAYVAYSLLCMYVLLPYLVCTSCSYYGHTCHSGQGQIAGLLFSPRDRAEFAVRFRHMRLAAPVFLAPLVGGITMAIVRPSFILAANTIGFGILALGCARLVTQRLGCPRCKQQSICPTCHPR
jgi:hypothetical protein